MKIKKVRDYIVCPSCRGSGKVNVAVDGQVHQFNCDHCHGNRFILTDRIERKILKRLKLCELK